MVERWEIQAIERVRAALDCLAAEQLTGDRTWTDSIKRALSDIGRDLGFKTATAGWQRVGADDGEWLYDLVWYEDRDSWMLKRVPLVMESEWSPKSDDQKRDFQKLLVAKAAIKLWIFQADTDASIEQHLNWCREQIDSFDMKLPSERYLLAGYDYGERKRFRTETYVANQ